MALIVDGFAIPREQWKAETHVRMRDAARHVLAGVGDERSDIPEGTEMIYIIRRRCTDDERRHVQENYLEE